MLHFYRWQKCFVRLCVSLGVGLSLWTSPSFALSVDLSEAPSSNLTLTLYALENAHRSILINIYELTSPQITQAILQKIREGVPVQILEEGQRVGGMSAAGRGVQAQIVRAMIESRNPAHRFLEMTSKGNPAGKRRFQFNHAKYMILDGQALLIGSENYSPNGQPTPGTKGNRGWEVLVHDPRVVQKFSWLFNHDVAGGFGDLIDLTAEARACASPCERLNFGSAVAGSSLAPLRAEAEHSAQPVRVEVDAVYPIVSPDNSLTGLKSLIDHSTSHLDIEQMIFYPTWASARRTSPLLEAVVAAARRGVQVRVLLNDERVFPNPGAHNLPVMDYLNQIAAKEKLPMVARIADVRAMQVSYIHNKGALIDGRRVLVSSINWGEAAVRSNREAAVVLEGELAYRFYQRTFEADWTASERMNAEGRERGPVGLEPQSHPSLAAEDLDEAIYADPTAEESSIDCPARIRARLRIGPVDLRHASDPSFLETANQMWEGEFLRSTGQEGCVLVNAPPTSRSPHYLQIQASRNGQIAISLEGYTSTGQVYSIRTHVLSQSRREIQGAFNAALYQGSGRHGRLAAAQLSLGRGSRP